jgi:enoyl-[acyl-carrier protein] reductase II
VPQVADTVNIPVVAAGGIADGRGLVAALALGAQGIQMGTRFVCSEECVAHPDYKEKILKARDRATVVTGRSTGYAMRCLENQLTRQFQQMEKEGISAEEMDMLGRGKVRAGLIDGNLKEGSLLAGQIAGMINDIKPVKTIISDIMTEAEDIINNRLTHSIGKE